MNTKTSFSFLARTATLVRAAGSRVAMTLLLLLVTTTTAWADADLIIRSTADWNTFAANVSNGTDNYAGKTVILAADISVSTMAGDDRNNWFYGTFDGCGHTLTINLTGTYAGTAPFRRIYNATIKNLNVTGAITTTYGMAGSIAFVTNGTTHISNCLSTVTITGNGKNTDGGLVSCNNDELHFTNCAFKGEMLGTDSGCGGFVGWNNSKIFYNHCLFAPSLVKMSTNNSATFNRENSNTTSTFDRCYYTYAFGTVQGFSASGMSNETLVSNLGSGWEVSGNNVVPKMINSLDSYLAYNTSTHDYEILTANSYTVVTSRTTTMGAAGTETWYMVSSNVTVSSRITVNGTVHLILCDGKTLTASQGITVNSGNSLAIYGQTAGTGALNTTGTGSNGSESAAIGGTGNSTVGSITIHGGRITANGASWSAGIGGGLYGGGGSVAIYGGTVNATGHDGTSEAIGHGSSTETAVAKDLIDGLRVTTNNNSTPVAYGDRKSSLSQKVARVEPCKEHNLSNNVCTYCGLSYYGVTYNGNNATGGTVPASAYYTTGQTVTVTVSGNTGNLVRTGYTFAGWNTAADGSGITYTAGATFTIYNNVTLYAQWGTPDDLDQNNITYTTADVSWTGTSDSYVVQYGTWTQVGTDHITTATLTPYTFDLSQFSGKGTVAIRHYNVTDMFRMNVDDIVVKDATGATVYSQNFEGGSIPSDMSNIDFDGDGNVWVLANSDNMTVNGSYGVYSASWISETGPLTPDNWLVISDIQLGGSITFKAVGQDKVAVSENFGVYVIADNQFTQAYSGTSTSCQLTGLTEGTPYVWRVKGVCGEESSRWVSSMFKTKDDLLVFTTAGNWNVLSNWTDADGNAATALPTANNKVRIDAAVTITDGVVATAKSTIINGGSITINEGGQLKQGSTVKVTMHKGITGYGAGNEAAGHYYLIATPHSCSYLEENTVFPYVLNMTAGDNDLYAFDPTQGQAWINYESNSDHSEFHTGDNYGLFNKKGYLYANAEDKDLTFVGTVSSSLNNTLTDSYTYNPNSTDPFNGWKLVGNPFTCNSTISFVDGSDAPLGAIFYKMNNSGDGFVAYQNFVVLAPGEGAFIHYTQSGTIKYSSEVSGTPNNAVAETPLPMMPQHGLGNNQIAIVVLADDNTNNSSIINGLNDQIVNVTLSGRTLWKDGDWNTLCLPFALNSFTGTPLEGATVKTLSSTDFSDGTLTMNFSDNLTSINAGVPYIVKWTSGSNIVNPVFTDVTISNTPAATETAGSDWVDFVGTYSPVGIYESGDKHNLYLGEGNTLYYPTASDFKVNACRAYFQLKNGLTAGDPADPQQANVRAFMLNFGEDSETGETTSLNDKAQMINDKEADAWYDLSGRKLSGVGAGPVPARLPKGVYINNGRKVVIK